MFGFKLISEKKLKKLEGDLFMAEVHAKTTENWWSDRWLEVREQQEKCIELMTYAKETIPLLEEALEQQTREKKELQIQFDGYRALEFLNR